MRTYRERSSQTPSLGSLRFTWWRTRFPSASLRASAGVARPRFTGSVALRLAAPVPLGKFQCEVYRRNRIVGVRDHFELLPRG